jgi:hypothetical protein
MVVPSPLDLEREKTERKDAELAVAAYQRQLASLKDKCGAIQAEIEQYSAITDGLRRGTRVSTCRNRLSEFLRNRKESRTSGSKHLCFSSLVGAYSMRGAPLLPYRRCGAGQAAVQDLEH